MSQLHFTRTYRQRQGAPEWLAGVDWSTPPPPVDAFQTVLRPAYSQWLDVLTDHERERASELTWQWELARLDAVREDRERQKEEQAAKAAAEWEKEKVAHTLSLLANQRKVRSRYKAEISRLSEQEAWFKEYKDHARTSPIYTSYEKFAERLELLKRLKQEAERWEKYAAKQQREDWEAHRFYNLENGPFIPMQEYDNYGIWRKNPKAWRVQRELVWASYWLLTLATHWPGPDSAGIVLLDFIARLHDSGMWVIAYAGDYAGLRLDMPRKTCQDGIQWLKEAGYLIHRAGKRVRILQKDSQEGDPGWWDPMRYEINLSKLLELLMENSNMDKANFTMPEVRSLLPSITERRRWARNGGFKALVIYNYLSETPKSIRQLTDLVGWNRRTVSRLLISVEHAGLAVNTEAGWVVHNSP